MNFISKPPVFKFYMRRLAGTLSIGKNLAFFRRPFLYGVLLAILAPANPALAGESSDGTALRHLKTVLWPQAYRTQDVELLDRLLHDSFQMIDGEGNYSDKNKEMTWVRENTWNPGTFEYIIERLDIYDGRMAIVSGTGNAEKYSYRSSNVLIKENGAWRAVSSHVSGYQEK